MPSFGSDISTYSNRIRFIIKTGIKYEKKKDYESLRDAYSLRSQYPEISDCMFALPQSGQESDVLQAVLIINILRLILFLLMMIKLYYILLGALLGSATVLVMSILNLILISYIGCSYMSLSSSAIGICLPSVLILILTPIVFGLSLKQV